MEFSLEFPSARTFRWMHYGPPFALSLTSRDQRKKGSAEFVNVWFGMFFYVCVLLLYSTLKLVSTE